MFNKWVLVTRFASISCTKDLRRAQHMGFTLTNKCRRQQVTGIKGYNNEVWPFESVHFDLKKVINDGVYVFDTLIKLFICAAKAVEKNRGYKYNLIRTCSHECYLTYY